MSGSFLGTHRIDWKSEETHVLFNPRMPLEQRRDAGQRLHALKSLSAHFWMATSGSTAQVAGQLKWIALSKSAVLASAQAVNSHLRATATDVWAHALPDFHVGGMGIFARSHLNGARVIDGLQQGDNDRRWNAEYFHHQCVNERATLSALVPTQVYDLIQTGLKAPDTLRAIVIGGAALSKELYFSALELGWPLLPSYGMTECCSQIATATLESIRSHGKETPLPVLLPHVQARTEAEPPHRLQIQSHSLLTGLAVLAPNGDRWFDPKQDGWFTAEDKVELLPNEGGMTLRVLGRGSDFVKIGGESVDMSRLSDTLTLLRAESKTTLDLVVISVEDPRLGHVIHGVAACAENNPEALEIFDRFNARVLPFERAREIHFVDQIPRSPLQKLLKAELVAKIKPRS